MCECSQKYYQYSDRPMNDNLPLADIPALVAILAIRLRLRFAIAICLFPDHQRQAIKLFSVN